jgi:pimeloyl-ACP methyl ester carboxylesterase
MDAVERQRANPRAWGRWLSMAHTVPRELLAIRGYRFEPAKFAGLTVPLRILVGGASRPAMRRTAERIRAAVPQADIVELPGQGHAAMTAAPEMFASAVATFFNSVR